VTTYTWTWLEDIDTWVHIADTDNLVYVHGVVTADACKLVGEGDIDSTEGIFNDFSHLSCTNIGNYDIALAETGIVRLHFLANLTRVSTYGTIVMDQLVNHIARDDAFRCMHKVDVFANHEAILLDDRTHEFVDSTRANG